MIKRIGYACKTSRINSKGQIESIPEFNSKATTVAWLNRQTRLVAEQKLWDLMSHNIMATKQVMQHLSTLEPSLRMFRISSDLLPVYTESNWSYFWQQHDVKNYAEKHFNEIGDIARKNNIRVSFHPGQFCCLASDNEDVVRRSIEEFEYHADMARWIGYGQQFQDMKINVHIAGRRGVEGIKAAYKQLSTEARNCITIENEEITHGLSECLELGNTIPIVLDLHHHLIHDEEYIQLSDIRISQIINSWRGIRPVLHYSVSREDVLVNHTINEKPNIQLLLENGYKKSKLRAHSQYFWNEAVNLWALEFLDNFDIMCEVKSKNLASFALHELAKQYQLT